MQDVENNFDTNEDDGYDIHDLWVVDKIKKRFYGKTRRSLNKPSSETVKKPGIFIKVTVIAYDKTAKPVKRKS